MKEQQLIYSDREICHFREQLSRIIRQVDLIKKRSDKLPLERRLEIIQDLSRDVDELLRLLNKAKGCFCSKHLHEGQNHECLQGCYYQDK